jgi:hypothetical protein
MKNTSTGHRGTHDIHPVIVYFEYNMKKMHNQMPIPDADPECHAAVLYIQHS